VRFTRNIFPTYPPLNIGYAPFKNIAPASALHIFPNFGFSTVTGLPFLSTTRCLKPLVSIEP
jgi:hypothetical protein